MFSGTIRVMVRYAPVNLLPAFRPVILRLAQAAPSKPRPTISVPSILANLVIMAGGVGMGILGFHHRQRPLGAIALGAGGSIAGAGIVLLLIDIFGTRQNAV